LSAKRNDITIISQDSFYRDDLSSSSNFDLPESLDLDLLRQVLLAVNSGNNEILQPKYDFITHTRCGYVETSLNPIVLFEGHMFPLINGIDEFFNHMLFYDTPLDVALLRRIKRDFSDRGRSIESICNQYIQTVRDTALKIEGISKNATHTVSDYFMESYNFLEEQGVFDYCVV
jgi:uridine kinase